MSYSIAQEIIVNILWNLNQKEYENECVCVCIYIYMYIYITYIAESLLTFNRITFLYIRN